MMRNRLALLTTVLLSAAALGQTHTSIKVNAIEPQSSDLERLNLTVAWRFYLPLKNGGDTVSVVQADADRAYVQLRSGLLMAVQAYPNQKTFRKPGDIIWQFQHPKFAGTPMPVAVISKLAEIEGRLRPVSEVYAVYGQELVVLDGNDGKLKFSEELPSTASAGPVADEEKVYIPLDNRRIIAFSHQSFIPGYAKRKQITYPDPVRNISTEIQPSAELSTTSNRSPSIHALQMLRPPFTRSDSIDISPSISGLKTLTPPYQAYEGNRSPSTTAMKNLRDISQQSSLSAPTRIKQKWEVLTNGKVVDKPVLYSLDDAVQYHSGDIPDQAEYVITTTGRTVITMPANSIGANSIRTTFVSPAEITAPLTNHKENLYVCTIDGSISCLNIKQLIDGAMSRSMLAKGKFTAGGPVEQTPLLVDDSLYVIGSRWGLIRLKKGTLEPMWTESTADGRVRSLPNEAVTKVLSANSKYVYALNRAGELLVLDARRGTTLSSLNVSAFNVPVVNNRNDRLYLASPNGLVLCMHDRNLVTPQRWLVGTRNVEAALNQIPKKDAEAPAAKKDEPEMKKDPEAKKDPEPKKDPEAKKDPEPKKDPEAKKDPEPKKE